MSESSSSRSSFRRLLPASGGSSPTTAKPLALATKPPPRINPVKEACNECRKHKAKCSGERPTCRRCAQRRLQCFYTRRLGETRTEAFKRNYQALENQGSIYKEAIDLLKTLPEKESQDVLKRIRSGTDITTILNHVQAADLLVQMAVTPETRFRYEFPYRSAMPAEYISDNPYLESILYEAASLYQTASNSKSTKLVTSSTISGLSPEYQSLYLKPFHAAQVIESQLLSVDISAWTTVCGDNMLMRGLLGNFFHCEYHFTAAFHKDYFLQDMAAGRTDFCSSLLVNVVLGYACVCYPGFQNRVEYWNPHTLLYRFIAEAKRLWELEANEPRLTTIQAGIIFNVFHNLCGLDEVGQAYRIQSIALAHKLRLFDGTPEDDNRIRQGKEFAAWSLYNWETLVGFSFMFPPLLTKPPTWPLPDASADPQWYGEIWVQYPLNHSLLPLHFSHVFWARSQFRIIMNEFCQVAYSNKSAMTLKTATKFYIRLQRWFNELPSQLYPRNIVLPGHLQLHMYYHHLILTIYEPLLDVQTTEEPTPQQIVAYAKKYLQTLVRLYYLRHGFESMDLFIVIPLMLSGYECIDAIDNEVSSSRLEVLRSTLILVAKGLYSQRRNHYLAEALYRVIRGRMRPQEVALLRDTVDLDEEEPEARREMVQAVRSHWPVSVVKNMDDLDSHILGNLVENYAHLDLEEQGPAGRKASEESFVSAK